MQLRSLLEMENQLDTIRLTDMTKRRANVPLYRQEAFMRSKQETKKPEEMKEPMEPMEGQEEVDPDVNLLKNLDISGAITPELSATHVEDTISPMAWRVCLEVRLCLFRFSSCDCSSLASHRAIGVVCATTPKKTHHNTRVNFSM